MAVAGAPAPALQSVSDLLADRGRGVVVSGISKDPNGKVTLVLVGDDGQPAVVVKIAPTASAEAALEAEAAVLEGLERTRLGVLAPSVPQVLGWAQHGGRLALVLTGLPGRSMLTGYHTWRHTARPATVAGDFNAVSAWLAAFQSATSGGAISLSDQTIAATLQGRFAHLPLLSRALELLDAVQERLRVFEVPACTVHGDLWPGNILEAHGVVSGVVDWEAGRLLASPTSDRVRYALTYALYLDKHTAAGSGVAGHRGLRADRWGAGFRHLLAGSTWFGDVVAVFIASALERLDADPHLWRVVLLEGLAGIAATADDLAFATHHLEVFAELAPAVIAAGKGRSEP